jgi:hypothetical protein
MSEHEQATDRTPAEALAAVVRSLGAQAYYLETTVSPDLGGTLRCVTGHPKLPVILSLSDTDGGGGHTVVLLMEPRPAGELIAELQHRAEKAGAAEVLSAAIDQANARLAAEGARGE